MKEVGALGTRIARDAARVDRTAFEYGFAIRCTVGVAFAIAASSLAHVPPLAGAAAALGAISVGFASRQGVYRTRAAAMVITAFAMALSAFAACVAGENLVASVVLAAIFGYAYGIIGSLGTTALTVAVNSAVALAVFGRTPLSAEGAAYQSLFVIAGGLVQTVLLVAMWPLERFSSERTTLATGFQSLATYARSIPSSRLRSPSSASFVKLASSWNDMQPFATRGAIAAFESLFDEIERIRGALGALAADKYLLERRGEDGAATAIGAAGTAAAAVMSEIANALTQARAPEDDDTWLAFDAPLETLAERRETFAIRAHADLQALLGQLRSAWSAAYAPSGESSTKSTGDAPRPRRFRLPRVYANSEVGDAIATLRANLSLRSEYARHGFRLALVLAVAVLLEHVLPLNRAYWIVLTAAIVLRPDFGATFARGFARIGGTLAGAIVASLIAALHPNVDLLGGLAIVFAFLSYLFIPVNYGLFTMTITGYVVFVTALSGSQAGITIFDRILATLLGGALALLTYAVWPTWERRLLPMRFAELLDALATYGSHIFEAYTAPSDVDDATLRRAQLNAWLARSNAEASFERMTAEPVRPNTLTVRAALGILAASRRYGLALLSLNVHRPTQTIAAVDAFRNLTEGFATSLETLAAALRARRKPGMLPPLRELHGTYVAALGETDDVASDVAAAETDLMVDALNAMARLATRRFAKART